MPGNVAPNFLCAKLIYKILSYRFGDEVRRSAAQVRQRFGPTGSGFLQRLELASRVAAERRLRDIPATSRLKVCCASARLPASR